MFDLAHLGVVAWPVTLTQQATDGTFVDTTITVRYRVFSREELRTRSQATLGKTLMRIHELVRDKANPDEIAGAAQDIDTAAREEEGTLLDRITGWSGVGNAETGGEVPYSPDIGRAVIALEPHYQALWRGLLEASQQARPKNSLPGADGSPAPGQTTTT